MPFPSYKDAKTWGLMSASQPRQVQKRHNQPFPSTSEMDVTNLQLEIEEIYVVLHLVCTLCRAVILGYNAWEKCRAGLSDGELLKFSELIALLPTGNCLRFQNI